jgi:hypothetical protein
MEKTRYFTASALLSLLMICACTCAIFANTTRRSLFGSSAGANALMQLGKPAPGPIQRPDILIPDKTDFLSPDKTSAPLGIVHNAPVDFDGDGKTDFVVVRNTGGGANGQLTWYYAQNGGPNTYGVNWGLNSDWVLTQDFDGDLKDDIAIWRPGAGGTAGFWILQSATNTLRFDQFGQTGDVPSVSADYDGDGKADPAVFRNGSQALWYYHGSLTGNVTVIPWGTSGDIPYPGDFDGDGKTDFGIARDFGNGQLIFWRKLNNGTVMPNDFFGTPADYLVPGDYDGDGKTDIASINLGSNPIRWSYRSSANGTTTTAFWGVNGDIPAQGDYDGDGKTDFAIWRHGANPGESMFWVQLSSTGGTQVFQWGLPGDFPAATYFVF